MSGTIEHGEGGEPYPEHTLIGAYEPRDVHLLLAELPTLLILVDPSVNGDRIKSIAELTIAPQVSATSRWIASFCARFHVQKPVCSESRLGWYLSLLDADEVASAIALVPPSISR